MSSPQCGLCGSKGRLTVTACCNNLICDDEADYDPFSPALNSCHGNHKRRTLCAYHYNEQHKAADWRKCKECLDGFDPAEAEDYATNSFNFKEKNENVCKECKEIIDVQNDDFVMRSGNCYCLDCALSQYKPSQSSGSQNQVQTESQAEKREEKIVKEESKAPEQPIQNVQNRLEQSGSKSSQNRIEPEENKCVESQNQTSQVNNEASNENRASTSLRASRMDSSGKKTPMKSVETQTLDQEMSTGRKYGKRKAKAEVVEDEEVKSSPRKKSGKKVKKNEDAQGSGNKKNVEIFTEKRSTRSTRSSSSKEKRQGSSSKKEVNDSEDLEVGRTRSSSNRKEKPKKKVGTKKRL